MSTAVLDNVSVGQLGKEMRAALTAIGEKYGVKIDLGTISYTPTTISAKITGAKATAETLADPRLVNLKPLDVERAKRVGAFGKVVKIMNRGVERVFEITSYNGYVFLAWEESRKTTVRFNQNQSNNLIASDYTSLG